MDAVVSAGPLSRDEIKRLSPGAGALQGGEMAAAAPARRGGRNGGWLRRPRRRARRCRQTPAVFLSRGRGCRGRHRAARCSTGRRASASWIRSGRSTRLRLVTRIHRRLATVRCRWTGSAARPVEWPPEALRARHAGRCDLQRSGPARSRRRTTTRGPGSSRRRSSATEALELFESRSTGRSRRRRVGARLSGAAAPVVARRARRRSKC